MSVWNPSGSGDVHVDSIIGGSANVQHEVRMNDQGRHCVYKIGSDQSLGCYDTHGEALQNLATLYTDKKGGRMSESASFLLNIESIQFSEGSDSTWIHALPLGEYMHPTYGKIAVTADRVARFAENVKKKIRGIDPSINYNHDNSSADGATGWVKDAQARSNGLWLFVEFVKDAAQKVRDKKFRYFSLEFANEWLDAQGQKFNDVVLGGALTNRPFMKNLVPINLSESVIDNAFDLVGAITGKTDLREDGKDNGMKPEELQAIIDGVTKNLTEKFQPVAPDNKNPAPTPIANLAEIAELKQLADTNPMVKTLLAQFESQAQNIMEQNKTLRETQIEAKLAEFDNSTLVLTPAAKELVRGILFEMPHQLSEKFWELMDMVRTSQSFLVELGERSGAAVRRGFQMTDKSATQLFMERVNATVTEKKLSFIDAVAQVAAEDPALYDRYRAGEGAQPVGASR